MSIIGKFVPTDALYPTAVLIALQGVQKWLANETKDNTWLLQFYRILGEMAEEKPFDPASKMVRRGGEMPLTLPRGDDGLCYRRPVWELIAKETHSCGITTSSPIKFKAGWLMQQLNLCKQYLEYETALASFRVAVLGLNLSFHENYEGFLDDVDVVVQGGFKAKGEKAKEDIQKIIDSLIPALTKHIQETRNH